MDIAEAIAHANCSAALSASPEHVAQALQVLAARVAELETPRAVPAKDACTACEGWGGEETGAVFDQGECVEPPSQGPCVRCLGSGMRGVQNMYARLVKLEAERGEPTGTEWGVRWAGRPDEGGGIEQHHERTPDGGERYARRVVGIHDPYGRGSAVLVKRQLGPWVVAQ